MKSPFLPFLAGLLVLVSSCKNEAPSPPGAILPVPNEYQLAWHDLEQYAFVHFTTNTFTGKEWGYGDESPSIFNPTEFNAEQWAVSLKEAGMKGLVLTCKHHDGFCLWPSKYTEHSVKNSPYKNGQGDIVREVSDACRKHGLQFGIYLSPWDRNFPDYGKPEYITYYRNQLRELIENYGPVFEVWFDGANGGDGYYGGAREMRKIDNTTYYDWKNTHAIVRELAPQAMMFSDAGPDIRWCGNEKGYVGDPNWNTISNYTLYPGKAAIGDLLNHGSENGTSWVPAEVDVSIRPGWFYHAEEDNMVRTPENLFKIYLESVGRGSCLILNIPPDQRGVFHEKDVEALKGWKALRDKAFSTNLAGNATVKVSSYRGKHKTYAATNVTDRDMETYWTTDDGITDGWIEFDLNAPQKISYVTIKEYIRSGQRIKSFSIEAFIDGAWKQIAEGSTIGHKRIIPIDPVSTQKIRLNILKSKACPIISDIEIF